jgi:hypothetical protein
MRHSAAIERRLAAAEQTSGALLERRVAELLAAEFARASEPVQRAITARLRAFHQQRENDRAWHPDAVAAFLAAIASVAPDVARRVAGKLRIEI